jgi:hypothetical protein
LNVLTLLLPVLLIAALFAGVVMLRRRLFEDEKSQAPIPIPDLGVAKAATPKVASVVPPAAGPESAAAVPEQPSLTPSRLYPRRALTDVEMSVFSRLLKALPGYVVLPKITYDHFLEARDGSLSENTSLRNRAAGHLADFLVCDKKLYVLLVCQIEDGTQIPARIQEREKMLQKSGLRLLRWNVAQPPDPATLLNTVETLTRMRDGMRGTSDGVH